MSKIEMLRLLINQRLTAAAEEIFDVFGRTIAEYEREISRTKLEMERQRRLLELSRKPQISLQAEPPGISEQQEWSRSSADPNEEESATRIKEEEQEQEVWSEAPEENLVSLMMFKNNSAGTQPDGDATGSPGSGFPTQNPEDADAQPGTSVLQPVSELDGDPPAANSQGNCLDVDLSKVVDSYICTICGLALYQRSQWAKHMHTHRKADGTAEKSFTCHICGKKLTRSDGYQKHMRVHTGEKPYSCHVCGHSFSDNSNFKRHMRRHATETSKLGSG